MQVAAVSLVPRRRGPLRRARGAGGEGGRGVGVQRAGRGAGAAWAGAAARGGVPPEEPDSETSWTVANSLTRIAPFFGIKSFVFACSGTEICKKTKY